MIKTLFAALLFMAASAFSARATDGVSCSWLGISLNDGTAMMLKAEGLTIRFAAGSLVATDAAGLDYSCPLAEVDALYFSDEDSGMGALPVASDGEKVTLWTVDGKPCGSYPSRAEAASALPGGIYVIKNESGQSDKIKVKR